jgi:hypothetical protein
MGAAGWAVVIVAAVILVIVGVAAAVGLQRRRQLDELFDSEYAEPRSAGEERSSEGGQTASETGRSALELRSLPAAARDRYQAAWDRAQSSFVDRPALALHDADSLIASVMAEVGYPAERLEQQSGLAPVEHTEHSAEQSSLLDRYRIARRVNLRADSPETSTDELRHAFVEYRAIFDQLLSGAGAGEVPLLDPTRSPGSG